MSSVDFDKVRQAAEALLRQANQEGRLQELSNRIVRKEVEKVLELEGGTLEDSNYRTRLNDVIKEVVDSFDAKPRGKKSEKTAVKPKLKNKPAEHKSEVKARPPSSSKKSDSSVTAKAETSKKSDAAEKLKAPSKATSKVEVDQPKKSAPKSKELVEDKSESASKDKVAEVKAKATPTKKGKKRQVQIDEEKGRTGQTESPPQKKSKSKAQGPAGTSGNTQKGKEKEYKADAVEKEPDVVSLMVSSTEDTTLVANDNKSDSEMSSLIDEEPVKKRRKSEEKKPKGTNKEKKSTKAKGSSNGKEETPEEEQLKKMKSLVFACGVRKVWSKELKDIEPISKQISHVRGILSDLGMKGRFSLEQARAIKEKREFQQELDEVREFAAKHAGEGRPTRSAAGTSKPAVSSDSESEESEEETVGPRRAKNARQSIMAFLQDQSDSE